MSAIPVRYRPSCPCFRQSHWQTHCAQAQSACTCPRIEVKCRKCSQVPKKNTRTRTEKKNETRPAVFRLPYVKDLNTPILSWFGLVCWHFWPCMTLSPHRRASSERLLDLPLPVAPGAPCGVSPNSSLVPVGPWSRAAARASRRASDSEYVSAFRYKVPVPWTCRRTSESERRLSALR